MKHDTIDQLHQCCFTHCLEEGGNKDNIQLTLTKHSPSSNNGKQAICVFGKYRQRETEPETRAKELVLIRIFVFVIFSTLSFAVVALHVCAHR